MPIVNKIILSLFVALAPWVGLNAQQAKVIKLKNLPLTHNPEYFYIANVLDDRTDTTTIGTMKAGLTGKVTPITLQGGAAAGLRQYLDENLKQDKTKLPVEIHLNRFEVKEVKDNATPQVKLYSELSFYARGMNVYKVMAENYAQGGYDVSAFIGKIIQQAMDYHLKAFDNWLALNPISITGNNTEVSVEMLRISDSKEIVPYSKSRLLHRDDFMGMPDDLSMAAAVTLSGIAVKYGYERLGGKTKIKITVLPYFDKSKSWWRVNANTPGILAHEQLHFDITAIHACELKKALQEAKLEMEQLEKQVGDIVNAEEQRRITMQQLYDKETSHGINKSKQAEWQAKVKELLAEQNCY